MTHLLQLLLLLALITIVSKAAGAISTRFGQPAVFGEILAGLLLGPSLLDILGWSIFAAGAHGSHPALGAVVHDFAEIGVILLMFVAGTQTDLVQMRRVGRVAFWAASGGVLLPLLAGAALAHAFDHTWAQGFFIGAVLTATSVSISAQTLMELRSLRSREGSAIMGAAVIDDVMGIVVLSVVVGFAGGAAVAQGSAPPTAASFLWIVGRMAAFFVVAWFAGRRLLEPLAARIARLHISEPLMALVVATAFLYAYASEALGGMAAITGSYMAGLLFAQTRFRESVERGIHPLTYSFFVPVFFVNIGLQADVGSLGGQIAFTAAVIGLAILSKVVGCGLGARLSGFSGREALRVGVGMISRGEVGLIVAGYGLAHGIIDTTMFSAMVLMVLLTTMITPLWLRFVFPRVREVAAPDVYESVGHLEGRAPEDAQGGSEGR